MMRRFVLVAHKARTTSDFSLEDLPGSGGRMDIVVRCMASAFLVSHDIRRDVELTMVLQGPPGPPKTLRIVGSRLRSLNPDERSTASLIRMALSLPTTMESESTPGIFVSRSSLSDVLRRHAGRLVRMREGGEDLRSAELSGDELFLLSDHEELTADEERLVGSRNPATLSVGPKSLHSDQVVVLIHNELDRREGGGNVHEENS